MEPPINILIVDDEPINLTVLESVLNDPGYRLVRAESADQALLALVVEEFALLILDIRMPGTSGIELAQIIKERKKTALVPMIFLTAYYNDDQHILEGYGTGAVDYLHKPVNAAILRSKVAVFAELHRKNREVEMANRALLAEVTKRLRAEEQLRALTNRVVQAQETERGQVALDLHDNITQILVRSQALAEKLPNHNGQWKIEGMQQLREMLVTATSEVERISHNLRPSVLEHVGLEAILRAAGVEFAERTGLSVKVECEKLKVRLACSTEVAIFRILQEVLKNVEQHARARHVTLALTQPDDFVQLTITDDGIGFDPDLYSNTQNQKGGLGLLGMRERAGYLGGDFKIESAHATGTAITVRIPLPPAALAADETD